MPDVHPVLLRATAHVVPELVRLALSREDKKRTLLRREGVVAAQLENKDLGLHVPDLKRGGHTKRVPIFARNQNKNSKQEWGGVLHTNCSLNGARNEYRRLSTEGRSTSRSRHPRHRA